MATGEGQTRSPEEYRRATDFCESLRQAVELRRLAEGLDRAAHDAAHLITVYELLGLPFQLEVSIAEGTEAYVTNDDDVVDQDPKTFIATSVREISKHGVEFINRETGDALRVKGSNFEVTPVFPTEATSEPSPEA